MLLYSLSSVIRSSDSITLSYGSSSRSSCWPLRSSVDAIQIATLLSAEPKENVADLLGILETEATGPLQPLPGTDQHRAWHQVYKIGDALTGRLDTHGVRLTA